MKLLDIITATKKLSINENVGNRGLLELLFEGIVDGRATRHGVYPESRYDIGASSICSSGGKGTVGLERVGAGGFANEGNWEAAEEVGQALGPTLCGKKYFRNCTTLYFRKNQSSYITQLLIGRKKLIFLFTAGL